MDLITEQLAAIIQSEDIDIVPYYGYGIEMDEVRLHIEQEKKPVRYVQCVLNNDEPLSLSTNGQINTVNALFWTFAQKAREAVEAMADIIALGYRTVDGNWTRPLVAPFFIGGSCFWAWNPLGGWSQTADKDGNIYVSEQVVNIQLENKTN